MHQVTSEPSATVIDSNNAGDTAEVYSYFHTDPRAMQANLALLEICLVVVLVEVRFARTTTRGGV